MSYSSKELTFLISEKSGQVSGIFFLPENIEYLLLFAHGAGAGMNHSFMEKMAIYLADINIGTFRFNFPYTEKKGKRPDHSSVLMHTIQRALCTAKEHVKGVPILAGGKSMGGRMTSMAASKGMLPEVKGIVFFGFPLHAPNQPSDERSLHLFDVKTPMLFLQGSNDKLADLHLLEPVISRLGTIATLKVVEGADHSFKLPKSSGKSEVEVYKMLCSLVKEWALDLK